MKRTDTVSSLGTRIVDDEREEILKANCSVNLMSRFFSNCEIAGEKIPQFRNMNVFHLRPKTELHNYEERTEDKDVIDCSSIDYNFHTDRNEKSTTYEFHNACGAGNMNKVTVLLADPMVQTKINQLNKLKMTALDCAIENRKMKVIKLLLENEKCNINIGGGKLRSSLNLAIQMANYPAVVEILNSNKTIDFGITDDYGNNVFHLMMEKHFGTDTNEHCKGMIK